jgi:hypothetical protein
MPTRFSRKRQGRSRARLHVPGPVLGYTEEGLPIVPVTIKRHSKGNLLRLAACPFCGRQHEHGRSQNMSDATEGHRVSHCLVRAAEDRGYVLCIVGEEK